MTNIKLENLKERYDSVYQIYITLPKELQKDFFHRIKECKELKNKALSSVTLTSKNFLLSQSSKKLKKIHEDILEVKKANDSDKYKLEAQNLKKLFDSNKLTQDEKLYLAKQASKRNSFNEKDFIPFLQNELSLLSKSIASDFADGLILGVS